MAYQHNTLKYRSKTLDLSDLHLSDENRQKIDQLIEEFRYIKSLKEYDVPVDNKILLHGHTGCGKTATAHAIAKALNKKIITLNLGGFVSSRLGETGKNITEVFKNASYDKAVLFMDEFDFVGKVRDYDNTDSGEMKRLVNTLIQQIDNLDDGALLICATNHVKIIDTALLRRFQLKLQYDLPNKEQLDAYFDSLLSGFPDHLSQVTRTYDISYAEVKDSIYQQLKTNIIKYEKKRIHHLFSYGTLQVEKVQLETFGRKLKGAPDFLVGYTLKDIVIRDEKVVEISGTDTHTMAVKSQNASDSIQGYVYEITGEELMHSDDYEAVEYKRVKVTLKSGQEAWVYVSKNVY